jgi:internalin A
VVVCRFIEIKNKFATEEIMNNYENEIFVSYAWGGESERVVDELEQAFAQRGIRIVRDKKEVNYKGSIEAFEQRIGRGQCIVLIISDKYLRSEHCMYELVGANKNQNLRERIFPIVLVEAQIYKAIDRLKYPILG